MQQDKMALFVVISGWLILGVVLLVILFIKRSRKKRALTATPKTPFRSLEQQLATSAQALSLTFDEKAGTASMDTPHTLWLARVIHQSRSTTMFEVSAHPHQESSPGRPVMGKPPHHARALPLLESVPFSAPILFRAENNYDRFGKRLKINREFQTHDARFDELIYIESDAPDRLIELTLQDPTLREQIIQCIERGFHSVHLYELDALIKLRQAPPDRRMFEPDQLQLAINTMDALARRLPYVSVMEQGKAPTSYNGFVWALALVASFLSLFAFAFLKRHHIPLTDDLANASMLAALIGWFGLIPVVILVLRGRSTSLRDTIMWMGLLVFSLPLWTFLLTRETNALLDLDPPQEIAARVESTWRSGKNNTECNVKFSPDHRYAPFSVNIRCKDYLRLHHGAPVTLLIGQGALKEPWLKGWQPR